MRLVPPEQSVPHVYFGLHAHRLVERAPWTPGGDRLSPWPEMPFGSLRLWDAMVAWPNLQPQRGRWQFATLDQYVRMAEAAGVDVLLPLGLSPGWASARPYEKSGYQPGNAAEPVSMEDWRVYVRTVAERYKNRIRCYEVWNEINLSSFYSGSLETMVELARIAYGEIKRVDPAALVVSPSVTGDGREPQWLDRYLALGAGQYADVIGYHFYVPKQAPEAMLPLVDHVREIVRRRGQAHKPLWNTETGWRIEGLLSSERIGASGADWLRLDQDKAAAYVARALILGWAAGMARYYWYAWDNLDMGLYDTLARVPKRASGAYASTVRWLAGSTMRECAFQSGVWTCLLTDTVGRTRWIVWRESGMAKAWRLPTDLRFHEIELLDGTRQPLQSASTYIELGEMPILLRA